MFPCSGNFLLINFLFIFGVCIVCGLIVTYAVLAIDKLTNLERSKKLGKDEKTIKTKK